MVLGKSSAQRFLDLVLGSVKPSPCQRRQHRAVAFAIDQRCQNSSSRYSQHITSNAGELDVGVFQNFLYSVGDAGTLLDQGLPMARQIPELADRFRRNETLAQQSVLEQLGDPL